MEKVSIIIPVYNVEEYLPRCLESCIAQTYRNIEILVVNDGSKDQSLQIIQSFQEKDPRVILIDKENQGLYRARISGVQKASGRFLFFLDGDDYLPSDAVECLLDKSVLHSVDLVVANFYKEENGVVTPIPSFFHEEGVLEREEARTHYKKNVITKAIGVADDKTSTPDIFEIEVENGDKLLLCSDGLTNMVEDYDIKKIVKDNDSIEDAVRELIRQANENGGKDNISAILIEPEIGEE